MKCDRCLNKYPNKFINQIFTGAGIWYICPQCALDITNKVHGTNRTKFKGSMAQSIYEEFLEYKKCNVPTKGGEKE